MPRRPQDPGDEFSHADLAIAGGMTKRSVQLMADHKLLHGDRSIRDLKRICVIGAFVSAGAPIMVAGRLSERLLWAFNQPDGEMPSGLPSLAARLRDIDHSMSKGREWNDYWFHRALHRSPIYRAGESHNGDVYVEVADRRHVYLVSGLAVSDPMHGDFPNTTYEGWIDGWGWGEEPRFHSLALLSEDARSDATATAVAAYRHAVGRLRINASLAIRNGLDQLANHRAEIAA